MRILTAQSAPAYTSLAIPGWRQMYERFIVAEWGLGAPMPDWTLPDGRPIHASIMGSKWAVACDVCSAPYPADPDDPASRFFCPHCGNVRDQGRPRPIVYPSHRVRRQLESVLLLRPKPSDRNWSGEDLYTLIEENRQHGDPVPV